MGVTDGASVIAVAGGGTVSDMAGGGPATSGGARGAGKPLTLGKLSRLGSSLCSSNRSGGVFDAIT
jgi:hypothetical protein